MVSSSDKMSVRLTLGIHAVLVYAHVEKMGLPVLQRVVAVMGKGAKTLKKMKGKLKKINMKMNGIFLRFYKHSIER